MFYERKVWSLNGSKVNYASFNQQTCGKYFTLFFTKFIDENVPRIWEEQQTETKSKLKKKEKSLEQEKFYSNEELNGIDWNW